MYLIDPIWPSNGLNENCTSHPVARGDKIGLLNASSGLPVTVITVKPPFITKSPESQIACPILLVVSLLKIMVEFFKYVLVSLSVVIPDGPCGPTGPIIPCVPLGPIGPCIP